MILRGLGLYRVFVTPKKLRKGGGGYETFYKGGYLKRGGGVISKRGGKIGVDTVTREWRLL